VVYFLDTPSKKRIIYSIIVYFPIMSLIAGTPLPFPSLVEPTQGQIGILNGINLSISIVGAIIGSAFYLRNKSKKELEKLDEKIEEKALAHHLELVELKKEMKEMEVRLSNNVADKITHIEKTIELKVQRAKDIEDERFRRMDEKHNDADKRMDRIENKSHYQQYDHRNINKQGDVNG
jgi:gas vesicle protein